MKLINSLARLCLLHLTVFNVLIISPLRSQSPSVCPIGVGMEPKSKSELRPGALYNEIMFGLTPAWSKLSNIKFSDDNKSETTINGITRSRQIIGNNYKFQIPAGATINGIMLMVEGSSTNFKNIDELEIFLLDSDGEPKGHNKSNEAKHQKAWSKKLDGSDHFWMYGSANDTWGTTWTPAEINDPNFGFRIQIRNIDNTVSQVYIDQITILVDYTPAYSFCDDNCLTFYIDKFEKYGSYQWEPVNGFRLVSHTYGHQTIDLKSNNAPFGLYNICVNVFDKSGKFVEKCCRNFLYQDCNSSEIQGVVWADLNDNDLRDADDRMMKATSVFLFTKDHKPVDTVMTDDKGRYQFLMAMPGDYYVMIPEFSDKKFVLFKAIDPDNNSDITNAFGSGTTDLINVEIGKRYESIDLGYKPLVNIGNFVWEDINFNGLQDSGEKGIGGVKVSLLRQNMSVADSAVTDEKGNYVFQNAHANKYRLKFYNALGYIPTRFNSSDNDKNSKIDSTGLTSILTFTDSESRLNVDAGYYKPATIGDFVWEDKNGNGLIDTDEPGIANIKLTLSGVSGDGKQVRKEAFTGTNGKYSFSDLPPGKYDIAVLAENGYTFTAPNAGNDNLDSDVINGKIVGITVKSGDSLINYDIGMFKLARIGDFIWDDKNGNGIQDANESGIAGVSLTLTKVVNSMTTPVKTIVTDAKGFYLFDSLAPSSYRITVKNPEGYFFTAPDAGSDDTKDSDYIGASGITLNLMSGEGNLNTDIGLYRLGQIGNLVWDDINANGIYDLNEPGISRITVTITGQDALGDTVRKSIITDSKGEFLFDNLKPGIYHLSMISDRYVLTLPNSGADDTRDSDAINGAISEIKVEGGQIDLSRDFGLVKYAEIGDFVWEDQNTNGIQDNAEFPVAGVVVRLNGTAFNNLSVSVSDTTDVQGKYLFNRILPGKYNIGIIMPQGFTATRFSAGNNRNIDSNLPENGLTTSFEIAESKNDLSIDFGLLRLGSIGDLVWEDLNGDGQKQLLEPGIKDLSISLSGKDIFNTDVQRSVLSDSLGFYSFESLKPGTYTVKFQSPQGFLSTDTLTKTVSISAGSVVENLDIPFYKSTSVGDFVWEDLNGNGLQDTGEPGMLGVSVALSSVSDIKFVPQQMVTTASGQYRFDNLKPGTYMLTFGSLPDFKFTRSKAGSDDNKDSDVDSLGVSGNVILINGVSRTNIDAGLASTSTASIGNFVWEDMNGNGLQDNGEPAISGVSVSLSGTSNSGKLISKLVLTDLAGRYKFDSLPDGRYKVKFINPQNYFFTHIDLSDLNKNSDANIVTGETDEIILLKGQVLESIDAGLYRNASVGDFVWEDNNNNGIQDAGEPGISGTTVTISKVADISFVQRQTITSGTGQYKFENLKPGMYNISFGVVAFKKPTASKAGSDNTKDSDPDESGVVSNVLLLSGGNRTDIDAGYISTSTASIGGFVWEDLNANGIQDNGEQGISGDTVFIKGESQNVIGFSLFTLSDQNGRYLFSNLQAGTYSILFTKRSVFEFTDPDKGNDDMDSDAALATGKTPSITVTIGQAVRNIDAGLFRRGSIGDFVWEDSNNNGIQDIGEPGISGSTVTLSKVADNSFVPIQTTTTSSGQYKFENVKPGTYNITFGVVAFKKPTESKAGSDNTKDSDPDESGVVSNVLLLSGGNRTDIDAGYVSTSTASIGGLVWEDLNANGIQDNGERGISGDTVFIKGESQNVIGFSLFTLSDQNGRYLFSNLQAGTYSILFTKRSGFEFTDPDKGNDDMDSDAAQATGKTPSVTVIIGQAVRNIDAGLFRRGIIGDFVWNDLNENGLQDTNEPGLPGVILTLSNDLGISIVTDTSDSKGLYLFEKIRPGNYTVEAQLPSGFKAATVNTSDNMLNSDFVTTGSITNTTLITIVSNNQNLNIDLGLSIIKSKISGVAWKDSNGNGLKEPNEAMLDNVIVSLVNVNEEILKRDTTDALGVYLFVDVDPGIYKIKFSSMQNMYFTYSNLGNNDAIDSDVLDQAGVTSQISVIAGQDINNVSAGYVNSGSIGDFVWIDSNKDGLQTAGEAGLNGVKIYLLNNAGVVIDSTISTMNGSVSGFYRFSGLIYGNYSLKFSLPQNFEYTIKNISDTLSNSDIEEFATGKTKNVNLLPGQNRGDIDAGYVLMAVVSGNINGTIWQDNNGNKFRDAADSLLSGVVVSLFRLDGTLVSTTTSATNGTYSFTQVAFGDYYISIPQVNEKMFVLMQTNPLTNGSFITNKYGTGTTNMISVLPGSTVSGIDLGYFRKITIGDFVWEDVNNNGLQDANEPGISGISISLLNEAGVVEKSTISDNAGRYLFLDIGPGKYKIKFSLNADYIFANINTTDENKNSKANPVNGETALLDFLTLKSYTNIDAGYVKPGSVNGKVWLDLNGNGLFQTGEPGISDVKVRLFSENGMMVDSAITAFNSTFTFDGFYAMNNIRPGKYYVKFDVPIVYLLSPPNLGGDDNLDSDITDKFGLFTTDMFEIASGQSVQNVDAGLYRPATIGDRVWNDLNKNGIQESGEPGVANVTVRLYTQSGTLLATTTTNIQGIYQFINLRQRLYYLQFTLPAGFQFTLQNAAGSSAQDSDVDNTGTTPLISLAHGSILLDIDAGIHSTNARIVMGTVWKDFNEDGLFGTGEVYEQGVKVHFRQFLSGQVKTTITNHAGMYAFISNEVGEHVIVVDAPVDHVFTKKNAGINNDIDSDVNELGESDRLMLVDKYMMEYVNAGYYFKVVSTISGRVWKDKNQNRLRDNTDSLMQDVVIFLFDKSRNFIKSTKSNDKGEYSFKFLDPGQYYCRVPELPDMDFVMFTGSSTDKDSEITHQYGIGTSRMITIEAGIPFENFDFGYKEFNKLIVSDPKRMIQYEVFPNPVINEIRVKVPFDDHQPTKYFIINYLGNLVKSGEIQSEMEILETGHLPEGRYTIHFINGREQIMKSFIKIDN